MLAHSITTEDWLEYAKEKSREEGKIEGIEIGEKRGINIGEKRGEHHTQVKVAQNMLKLNIGKDIISEVTGLTLEEIDGL